MRNYLPEITDSKPNAEVPTFHTSQTAQEKMTQALENFSDAWVSPPVKEAPKVTASLTPLFSFTETTPLARTALKARRRTQEEIPWIDVQKARMRRSWNAGEAFLNKVWFPSSRRRGGLLRVMRTLTGLTSCCFSFAHRCRPYIRLGC